MSREYHDKAWHKSSYSGINNGDCVEVALAPEAVLVRDSKNPTAGTLIFTLAQWHAFTART